jgi:hypothetical protein
MSDAFQVSTPFPKNLILTAQDGSGNTYKMAKLTDNVVGVIPFNFFASKGAATAGAASTGITNMTPQLAQGLWPTGNGKEPLSLFTGNPADSTTFCYATGRNPDSGTRINAFAETGVGISSVVQQYVPTISGGAITSLALFPATTLYNVLPVAAGNNGESSGGNLDTDLEAAATNSTGYLIGYLGTSDSTTSLVGGAVQLAYNGVSLPNSGSPSYTFSNFSLIQNGQYTYWGYEHLDYLSTLSTTFPTAYSFANAVVTEIHNVTAQVPVTSMNVGRTIEGGEITLGNPY